MISWNTIRRTGTFGLNTCTRCHAIASPSRSSSVASNNSSADFSFERNSETTPFFFGSTTYSGSKSLSTFTPSRAHGSCFCAAGTSAAL